MEELFTKPLDFDAVIKSINDICDCRMKQIRDIYETSRIILERHRIKKEDLKLYYTGTLPYSIITQRYNLNKFAENVCAVISFSSGSQVTDHTWADLCEDDNNFIMSFCIWEDRNSAKILVISKISDKAEAVSAIEDYTSNIMKLAKLIVKAVNTGKVSWYDGLKEIQDDNFDETVVGFINCLLKTNYTDNEIMNRVKQYSFFRLKRFCNVLIERLNNRFDYHNDEIFSRIEGAKTSEELIQCLNLLTEKVAYDDAFMVLKIKNHVYENCDKELNLSSIAKTFSFNYSYFSRFFKEKIGVNFSDYITTVRINRAKELLHTRSYTIEEIAGMVGYKSGPYLSRIFKKQTNITPKQAALAGGENDA